VWLLPALLRTLLKPSAGACGNPLHYKESVNILPALASVAGQHLLPAPTPGNKAGWGHQTGRRLVCLCHAGRSQETPSQTVLVCGLGTPNRQFHCAHTVLGREGKRGGELAVRQCSWPQGWRTVPSWFCRLAGMQPPETTLHLPKAFSLP